MRQSQTLAVRASEVRARLNELAGVETLDDAQRGELDTLTGEYRDVEARYRAALTAESAELETREAGEPADPETREARELLGKAQLRRWITAALRGRSVDGIEAETGAAYACPGLIPVGAVDRGGRRASRHHPGADDVVRLSPRRPSCRPSSIRAPRHGWASRCPQWQAGTASVPDNHPERYRGRPCEVRSGARNGRDHHPVHSHPAAHHGRFQTHQRR